MSEVATVQAVREALHRGLAADPRTSEPMNALVLWTELGRGLAGTLVEVGAEPDLLMKIVVSYCTDHGASLDVNLSRWAYRLEPHERLRAEEAAAALQRINSDLEATLPQLASQSEREPSARRQLFIEVAKGWFPVGLDIMASMPAGRDSTESELLGALAAWCARYLGSPPSKEPLVTPDAPEDGTPARVRLRVL